MKRYLFAMFLIFVLSAPALAASDVRLDEVVVTATRTDKEVGRIPASVTVITSGDISNSSAGTVQDLLVGTGSVVLYDYYGTGTKTAVDFRGFNKGFNTAILVDGRKMNNIDQSGVDWNLIPLENVERIEIVRGGAGSVLYGDNAMAAVVNIITKKPDRERKARVEIGARAESFGGRAGTIGLSGGTQKLSYSLFGRHRETDGYRDNSEFKGSDLSLRLNADLWEEYYVDLTTSYHEDEQGFAGFLSKAEMEQDRTQTTKPNDGAEYKQSFVGVTLGRAAQWGEVELTYNLDNVDMDSMLVFAGNPTGNIRETEKTELKLKAALRGKGNTLVMGMDRLRAESDNEYTGAFPSTYTFEKTETGYYINDDFVLTKRTVLSAGGRVSKNQYKSLKGGVEDSTDFKENAYRLGASFNYTEGSKLYGTYSKSYRLPTTDDFFDFFGNVFVDLKHETAKTYEAGVVHGIGETAVLSVSAYTMDIENEIYYNAATFTNENFKETSHDGAEVGFEFRPIPQVRVSGGWTYTKAEITSGPMKGSRIPMVPEDTYNLGVSTIVGRHSLNLTGNWVGKRYVFDDPTNTQEQLGSYKAFDAKYAFSLSSSEVYVGARNILDEEYVQYAAYGWAGVGYYPSPGQMLYGGFNMEF
jgi:iron complex outermembrane receptor protein